jgi:hypothetical protein
MSRLRLIEGCLVVGMAAGAGSIDDMGLLRHGAMGVLLGGTLWSSSPFLLGFCCLPLQRAAGAAVSSRVPVTPDRSVVPGSGAVVISNS